MNFYNALKSDLIKLQPFQTVSIILLFPLLCMLLLYPSIMDNSVLNYYSQSNIVIQGLKIVGLYIIVFIPLLSTTIMYNLTSKDIRGYTTEINSLIPRYNRMFSRITISITFVMLSILILLVFITIQIIYLYFSEALYLNFDWILISKLIYYLILLPFLLLPFLEIIELVQSFTNNIMVSFFLPLIFCYTGNALVIPYYDYMIYSPINLPITLLKSILSSFFIFSSYDFILISCICIASILIFSYLILLRGFNRN